MREAVARQPFLASLAQGGREARNWRHATHILVLDVFVVEPGGVFEKLLAHGQHLVQWPRLPLEPRERLPCYLRVHTLEAAFQPQDFVWVARASARVPVRVHLVNAPVLHVLEGGELLGRATERAAPVVHDGVDIGVLLQGARESRCREPVAFVALLFDCRDDATLWSEHHTPAIVVVLVAAHLHLRRRRALHTEDWFLQGAFFGFTHRCFQRSGFFCGGRAAVCLQQ